MTLVDQDHIGSKSWKLIARTLSPTPSLFGAQRHPPTPRGTWGNFGETRGGVGKNGVLEHKSGNISQTCKDRGNVTMGSLYRNSPALFRTVPSPTLYGLPFPKIGVRTPSKTPIAIISGTGKAMNVKFGQYIQRFHPNKSPLKFLEKRERGRIQGLPKCFGYPLLSQEREKLRISYLASTSRASIRTKAH